MTPEAVLTLHILGASDQPEWCAWCALPSALRVHYAVTCSCCAPLSLRSFMVCTDCDRQWA